MAVTSGITASPVIRERPVPVITIEECRLLITPDTVIVMRIPE